MKNCEYYQAQAFDHLFGLLDADEGLELIEHAGRCDACRAVLQQADGQRKLIAAAAKTGFPQVRFEAPATVPLEDRPVRRVRRFRLPLPRHRARWAAAAVVLLAVAGLSLRVVHFAGQDHAYRQEVGLHEQQLDKLVEEERELINQRDDARAKAEADRKAAEERLNQLAAAQQKELDRAADAVLKRQVYLVVTGHETLRAGVPNDYRIEIKNMKGDLERAELDMQFRDLASKKVIFQKANVATDGAYTLSVPSDLPLRASNQVALEVVARTANGPQGALHEQLTLAKSSYLTQLVTDKPMYQPGETVRFRSLTLDRFSLRPATEDFQLVYTIRNPQGNEVFKQRHLPRLFRDGKEVLGPDGKPIRGIGTGEFAIPSDLADGGEFVLTVEEVGKRFPPERRKFLIRTYQKHRLNKELKFEQPSYGPGDAVIANGKVARAEGGQALAFQPVTAVVRVDGDYYKADGRKAANRDDARLSLRTDAEGLVRVPVRLPAQIDKGDASLTVEFTDGAVTEPLVRPIPVVVNKLQIEFFPEGGDLVAGVPNRVYFQARTPLDKPAEIKGSIVDDQGNAVASVRTLSDNLEPGINQGMGVFQLTPKLGSKYQLQIVSPKGIQGQFLLPAAVAEGVALQVPGGVTSDEETIAIVLHNAGRDRELYIGAYCRGALLDFQPVDVREGQPAKVSLKPTGGAGGVYRITVFQKQGSSGDRLRPLAERLVYRSPAGRLKLAVRADQKAYQPGEKVRLHLSANTEDGQPAPAVALVAVVDRSVLKMADERTARSLPTHFLLTGEVRHADDLEFADVLLGDHVKAAQALDLLLGTQGWRRFIESDPDRFQRENSKPKNQDDARCQADVDRLRVVSGKLSLGKEEEKKVFTSFEVRQEQILGTYKPQFEQVEAQLNNAQFAMAELLDASKFEEQKHEVHQRAAKARAAYLAAFARLEEHEAYGQAILQRALLGLGMLLCLAAGMSLAAGLLRVLPRPVALSIGGAATVGVCGLLAVGVFLFESPSLEQSPVASVTAKDKETAPRMPVPEAEDGEPNPALAVAPFLGAAVPAPAKPGALPMAPAERRAAPGNNPVDEQAREGKKELDRAKDAEKAALKNDRPLGGERQAYLKRNEATRKAAALPNAAAAVRDAATKKQGKGEQQFRGAGNGAAAPPGAGRRVGPGQPMAPPPAGQLQAAGQAGLGGGKLNQQQMFGNLASAQNRNRNIQIDMIQETPPQRKLIEELQKQGKDKNADGKGRGVQDILLRARQQAAQLNDVEPCVTREYAHRRSDNDESIRSDFAETLYWQPALVLANGQADIHFDLCDSETTFEVMIAAHTPDGRLGAATTAIVSRKPFSLSAVVPMELTANDLLDLPVAVSNNSDETRRVRVTLELRNLTLVAGTSSAARQEVSLAPRQRDRLRFRLRPTVREGIAAIILKGTSEPFGADTVHYEFRIVPEGFPAAETRSDMLEKIAQHEIVLPREWVKDTLQCELQVYPSSLADLQQGLEGLLREPHGCFEQTSTSNYPNVMILSYLRESGLEARQPGIAAAARNMLARGYQKLIGFECQQPNQPQRQGYEWFGGTAPPHEALTAYGLLQFRDMAKVGYPVDHGMMERTRRFLLSRRDGKGGFLRNAKALDQFGRAPDPITNAYIVWALTESDHDAPRSPVDDLAKEIEALHKQAQDANNPFNKDPYFLALVANSLLNRGRDVPAMELLKKLAGTQNPKGFLEGATSSITGSGGRDLQIEATALGMLAWLKANRPEFQVNVRLAGKWIGQQRGGSGAFGSTQATILALKALIANAKANRRPMEAGRIVLSINGQVVAQRDFSADLKEALILSVPEAEKRLKPGENQVQITVTGNNVLPYTLSCSYQALVPNNPAAPPVKLAAALDRAKVRDGETVRLNVQVENASGRGQGMAVAVIGLPAGLNLPENMEQLKNLAKPRNNGTEPGVISAFEVRNRELVLYWRDLGPKQKIELNLDLICRVPGEFRGPASRAYLYYNADNKYWIEPVRADVAPKAD